ncbi:GGDEF domain-containing protein [Rhodoferax koreense]|uniref:diguanylate cyclase n=1 Tax=Rhodoferax koreensis TaxID=1842727 RepID=A0A1P8K157_9BURK|nr:sensor domain-containing diguanylate cyclase [Rhodoferax koreense]APW39725.1 GGDEF domain-containing protein [Rhodoferax koreense]
MSDRSPSEIARETFKLLAVKRLAPTPDNYQVLYHEVAGTLAPAHFPSEHLRKIAGVLPAKNPGQQKHLGLLNSAINQRSWEGVQNALIGFAGFGMVSSGNTEPSPLTPLSPAAGPLATPEFLEQIARLIENALPALGNDDLRFIEQARELVNLLRQPAVDLIRMKTMLGNFSHRLSFTAEDQSEIRATLLHLLHMVFENIAELCLDDRWLKGQIDALIDASTPPLTLRRLDDVQRRLKDVIFKQAEAKGRAYEAQAQMQQLLATFVDRLSLMTESSSAYHGTIEECARQIEQAKTLEELGPVLQNAIAATRHMASETMRSRDDLQAMRAKTESAEAEISKLHHELDRVSAQARHDPLTGALNRRGLDEAIQREISTARRKGTHLCLALLDIDNFKKLNDDLGHEAGDAALTHLANVTRECMRPQDTLARYGGEEFVILLPDTELEHGIATLTRLQRELTKQFFLRENMKVLITFSAGVAQLTPDETAIDGIKRADQAMYIAKRTGKNRVLGG